ncbi:MAG: ribonuclease Z [Marinifilaceae bacterium]|jgi:ribonuclease Z|nr:ribonuclease Z [Marinifilaceae bacterium]
MRFQLTILGCNSALPTVNRFPTAQVLNLLERFFLIDCGEGTQIQMKRYRIPMNKIKHVFISHLHGDHFFGLIGLLSTFSLQNRKADLNVYSDPRLKDIIMSQLKNLNTYLTYHVNFVELKENTQDIIYDDELVEVLSFPLNHGKTRCWGFRFNEKQKPKSLIKENIDYYKIPIKERQNIKNGADFVLEDGTIISNNVLTRPAPKPRSYSFCTDTAYTEAIVPIVKNSDLLYHEATFTENEREIAKETFHSTARDASIIAKKANVKTLLIGHYSSRFKDLDLHLNEAKEGFQNTKLAYDGFQIDI